MSPCPDAMPRPARSPDERKKAAREKTRAYRERMRARGMRLIQVWVPDVNAPGFAEEARRQSLAIANSPHEADDQAFIDSIAVDWDD